MAITKLIILIVLIGASVLNGQSQGVSKSLSQTLDLSPEQEQVTTLYIQLSTDKVEIKKSSSNKIRITAKVKLSITSDYFLDHLVKNGRYNFSLSPMKDAGLSLKEKEKTPLMLRGQSCTEDIALTIYIPKTIKSVVFKNTLTGDSNVIVMR